MEPCDKKSLLIDKIKQLDDGVIDNLMEHVNKIEKHDIVKKKEENEKEKPVVDKTSKKYIVLLKFVNKLLANMGKSEIDDLVKFKDINKNDIITDANKAVLVDMEKELFGKGMFDKNACGFYRKTDSWVLNVFRNMCKDVGVSLIWYEKKIQYNQKVKSNIIYFIQNI